MRAAEHHIHAGDRPRARALLEAILEDTPPGPTRSDALRLLAEVRFNEQGFAGIVPLLEEALEGAGDPARAVAIELDLTYVHCNHNGNVPARRRARRPRARARRARRRPHAARRRRSRAARWSTSCSAAASTGRWSTARSRSRAGIAPVPLYLQPSSIAACLKLWTGRYDEARAELTALRRAACESGDESDLAYLLCWLAALEIAGGDLDAAGELADEAEVHAALAGSEFNRAWALAQRAIVMALPRRRGGHARRRGRGGRDLRALRGRQPDAVGRRRGRRDRAGDAATPPRRGPRSSRPCAALDGSEPLALVLVPAVEALIGLGELDRAEALLDRADARGAAGRAPRAAGRCCWPRAATCPAAYEETERALEPRVDAPLERARALLAQGQIARRRKQKKAARESLEAALAAVRGRRRGARGREQARDDIARLGRKRQTDLTASEGRVAELVAQGHSNKEVAQALFVTVHTVEVHLSRAYAKLGVRSRTQLAGRLAAARSWLGARSVRVSAISRWGPDP